MLIPGKFSEEIINKTFVSKIFFFDQIDSTNNFAKPAIIQDNSLVLTNHQLNGRGRFLRKWESRAGKNLTFTVKKKFPIKLKDQFIISCCVSNSVFMFIDGIVRDVNGTVSIKWPNDILLNQRKIAGILVEKRANSDYYIIGIGININQEKFHEDINSTATSLKKETGLNYNLNELIIKFICILDNNLKLLKNNKYPEIFNFWLKNNKFIGKEVSFLDAKSKSRSGIITEIKKTGEMIIEENGKKRSFTSGEILLKK